MTPTGRKGEKKQGTDEFDNDRKALKVKVTGVKNLMELKITHGILTNFDEILQEDVKLKGLGTSH